MAEQTMRNQLELGRIYGLILENEKSLQRGMYIGHDSRGEIMEALHYFVTGLSNNASNQFRTVAVSDGFLKQVDALTLSSANFFESAPYHHSPLHRTALSLLMKKAGLI